MKQIARPICAPCTACGRLLKGKHFIYNTKTYKCYCNYTCRGRAIYEGIVDRLVKSFG